MRYRNIFSAFVLLSIALSSHVGFSQSTNELNADQKARVGFSIHLLNYDNAYNFETSRGEACYQTLSYSVEHGAILPDLNTDGMSSNDLKAISDYKERLKALCANPPAWSALLQMEEAYQKYLDASLRKQSRYKE
jgi:hypothetical protein